MLKSLVTPSFYKIQSLISVAQLKINPEFYKKKELQEILIYSFKPIRSTE